LSSDLRAGVLAVLATALLDGTALAQAGSPTELPGGGASIAREAFLPRADFSFGWASLIATDRRFDWQATVGFDLDVVDYGAGRLRFRGDYEAILGRERRRYDLNQGNYAFEVSGSLERPRVELAVFSQHVSRHVVDREQVPAISWNTLGGRLQSAWTRSQGLRGRALPSAPDETTIAGEIELSRAMQQAFVDYTWLSRARVSLSRPLTRRIAIVGAAAGEVVGVKRGLVRHERVCGGRLEGGVRIRGGAAAVEAFFGYERRIDAFPTDRFRVRWFTIGARVVTLAGLSSSP
jgi:hypothetical protein